MTLSYPHENASELAGVNQLYRVERVKNSTGYKPLELLPKSVVDDLCRHSGWDVSIEPVKQ